MLVNNLSDMEVKKLVMLIYGAPGSGKTYFVGTIGEKLNTLIVDTEGGQLTLKYLGEEVKKNLRSISMNRFEDLDVIYKAAKINTVEGWKKLGVNTDRPFEAIVIDTISELQSIMIDKLRKGTPLDGLGDPLKLVPLQIQEWGKLIDLTTLTIKAFKELPLTFVSTFHEQMTRDELSGVVQGCPSLKGKAAPEIGKLFDIQLHMCMGLNGKYNAISKAQSSWQAKSRFPLADKIEDPTYAKLLISMKN